MACWGMRSNPRPPARLLRSMIPFSIVLLIWSAGCDDAPGVEKSAWPTVDPDQRAAMLAPPRGRIAVVIDTDLTNEIDDEFALIYALLVPEKLDVQAVYAAPHSIWPALIDTGTSVLDRRGLLQQLEDLGLTLDQVPQTDPARNMQAAFDMGVRVRDLMGADFEVFTGAPAYMPDADSPVGSDAVDDLIARAREDRDGPLYVVSLGAITNVASALVTAPDIVDDIVVVWTSAYPTFWDRPNASYNLAQDLPAARVVLDSGVPFVYLPGFYVGEELRVTLPEMQAYVQGRGPVGEFLYELYDNHPLFGGHFARSKVLWDLVPFAWLVEPDWLHTELVATPRLDETLRWQPRSDAPLMREALDVSRDKVFADLYTRLAAHADGAETPD